MRFKLITGGAGTGKSFLLRKMLEEEKAPHIVVAPTGIAAINVGGTTIHKAFSIGIDGHVSNGIFHTSLRKCEKVFVDEVSMVSGQLMNSMQEALDKLNIDPEIIAFGDLAQLQPVKADYFFTTEVPDSIERLTKNYRQSNDLIFAEILNHIRIGQVKKSDLDWINDQIENGEDYTEEFTTLAFTNATVDYINKKRLEDLPGEARLFMGQLKGNFKETECCAPVELELKPGARILMLNNDQEDRWHNGTAGRILNFEKEVIDKDDLMHKKQVKEIVQVQLYNRDGSEGTIVEVLKHSWFKEENCSLTETARKMYEKMLAQPEMLLPRNRDHSRIHKILSTGIDSIVVGAYTQYPIKLGYASTVHKAQGQTLDKVHIIPDGFGSLHGLTYVALSRLTNIAGLSMPRYLNIMDFKFDKRVSQYL